jgi:hypothetical protein
VAAEAVAAIRSGTNSQVFEHGLLFLTARDIAMAASKALNGGFDFSRYSALRLRGAPIPFSREEYEFLMACRRATTRGTPLAWSSLLEFQIREKHNRFLDWCSNLNELVSV